MPDIARALSAQLPDPLRRRICAAGSLALATAAIGGCASSPTDLAGTAPRASDSVVPFSMSPADGACPAGWAPYVMRRDLPPTRYAMVERDGLRTLHASGAGVSSGLQCAVQVDPLQRPLLQWQWRVDEVPAGMSVANGDTDDSPARVVVAFDGDVSTLSLRERGFFDLVELLTGRRLPYATLMYVWDAGLPVGEVVRYERSSRIQYIVAESGDARTGQWLSYERNVADDFKRVFGEPPPGPVTSVGVLTDSDDLKTDVNAWYGDIRLIERA